MDIAKLKLSQREQSTLEAMGFDSVEKIALCWRGDLGLGKTKSETLITRARRILAYEQIEDIKDTGDKIRVVLSDTSKPTIVSVERVLGVYDDLKRRVDGTELIIFKPERIPCSVCQGEPVYFCRVCGATLCEDCRTGHEHAYYQRVEIATLEQQFERVREAAKEYRPMPSEKRVKVEVGPSEEVIAFARQKGFAEFADTFFSELEGNDLMKKAISCALFSTPQEPVHVLVVGDPAGGKTLAKDVIAKRMGSGIELVGANTTRAGLVCNLASGERGVLTYSHNKVVLVDEFDKIPDQDVDYCLELMSNGKCSVHSAKVHETIESHFIMIAFANPVETVFVRDPIQEIGLPPILLSRFALIVKAEELETSRRRALLKRKLMGDTIASGISPGQLLSWLREARRFHPKFTVSDEKIDAYIARVDRLIEEYLKTPLRRDLRMGDYAKRVPMSIARAGFTEINEQTLDDAITLMEACVSAWRQ